MCLWKGKQFCISQYGVQMCGPLFTTRMLKVSIEIFIVYMKSDIAFVGTNNSFRI